MELIDEKGNLFGVVNVIDALVVLLVLAVGIAGIAVVGVLGPGDDTTDGDNGPSIETRYATIDLDTQSSSSAEAIATGDNMTSGVDDERLTVTDVYAIPTSSETADVTVRTEVEGTQYENGTLAFSGSELASGHNISIQTDEYDVTGSIKTVENTTAKLQTNETEVLFEQTVDQETAEAIETGDESQLGNETIGTLETVSVYPIGNGQYRVIAGATLETLATEDDPRYGSALVEPESTIAFSTAEYDLQPTIRELGTTEEPGEPTTTTVEIDLNQLGDREASQFEPGLTETAGGDTWATVTSVDREPASVIVETEDGNLHERQHPTKYDVTLTVELQTRETDLGLQFKSQSFRNGETIYLDFGVTTVEERAWIVD
ncbi:DUF4330 family protein [Halopiger xanaduensis]|uniref:DUF4330 domain-containing protein n=1 Tax=Halopiger xanaduensis (strain DSM 18323 / JCM 14033 / SH-6) TaxID=797210 RepID=F8DA35_HALXS|nr:DUF4330 family protein [Halopiger xanaduensis]AEH36956.1 hypothetical protein Halxa_2334 [Halopiger xanaduensis SH-6]